MFSKLSSYFSTQKNIRKNSIQNINSWGYFINNVDPDTVSKSNYDCIVIDSRKSNGKLFSSLELSYMRGKNNKFLLSYISLGEAEDYRPYWKASWKKQKPSWLGNENPEWAGNYSIEQYWHPEWWEITAGILDDVMNAGFDGIYIDKIDVYQDLGGSSKLKQLMIDYIIKVSNYCKEKNSKFLVISQNAEELLDDQNYFDAIDGIGKEELLYSKRLGGKAAKNLESDIRWSLKYLMKLKHSKKIILCVEYVNESNWQTAKTRLLDYGFIPYNGPKELDSLNEKI